MLDHLDVHQRAQPGPEGRARRGRLDDDEDSGGHRLIDTVRSRAQSLAAVNRELVLHDTERKKRVQDRPRRAAVPSCTASAACTGRARACSRRAPGERGHIGTGAHLFYAGRARPTAARASTYLSPEARDRRRGAILSRAVRHRPRAACRPLSAPRSAPSFSSSRCRALPDGGDAPRPGPYAAGLNAARWDLGLDLRVRDGGSEVRVARPASVVDIQDEPFLANIFRRLVAISLKHGAVPHRRHGHRAAAQRPEVKPVGRGVDPQGQGGEAAQGFVRAWVAPHLSHEDGGRSLPDPHRLRLEADIQRAIPHKLSVARQVPAGRSSPSRGTRRNARMLIEYVEGWLQRPRRQGHRHPRGQDRASIQR